MQRWFRNERETEQWMRPFTGSVMLPGYRRALRTNTRLFFDFYAQLLGQGFTENQLADIVLRRRWESKPPLQEDSAFIKVIYDLAFQQELSPSAEFCFFPAGQHPRHIVDRFK